VRQLNLNNPMKVTSRKKRDLITYSHPESIISEQFRMIHTNIKFSIAEQNGKTILITSPCTGDGKSTIAANLAVSMAQQKKKVLLIDANLRNPALHTIFNLPDLLGLTEVLKGFVGFEETVHHTKIGRLDVLTSGKNSVNPVELLASDRMKELLEKALKKYDVVLIDSYSVIDLTDTQLLSTHCDGVVLVLKNGKTPFRKAFEAKKVLEFAKAKLVGVILNEN
jgi:capsular exopolysaccharide synthesis family protein